jgi:hypothetical protein
MNVLPDGSAILRRRAAEERREAFSPQSSHRIGCADTMFSPKIANLCSYISMSINVGIARAYIRL